MKRPVEQILTEPIPLTLKPGESDKVTQRFNELSVYERSVLLKWISVSIKRAGQIFESHKSSELKELFKNNPSGFSVSHDAFKGAMLTAGFVPIGRTGRAWDYKVDIKTTM